MTTERKCLICDDRQPSKPENYLCDECLKPVNGINLTERGVGKAVADHIFSKANQLANTYGLQSDDKEVIVQDLTLKALQAEKSYTPQGATVQTYVKTCLTNAVIDIARTLQNAPRHANVDQLLRALELDQRHQAAKNPDTPYKPLTICTGESLQHLATDEHEHDLSLKIDIEAVMQTLTPRQREIVYLSSDGKTQEYIAERLGVTQPRIPQILRDIQSKFEFLRNSPL